MCAVRAAIRFLSMAGLGLRKIIFASYLGVFFKLGTFPSAVAISIARMSRRGFARSISRARRESSFLSITKSWLGVRHPSDVRSAGFGGTFGREFLYKRASI